MATPLTDKITALTTAANETTGASDTTLGDAVATLIAGYGGGGSVASGTYTPAENTLGPSFDVGTSVDHFVIFATSSPLGSGVKTAQGAIVDYTASSPTVCAIGSNNAGSSGSTYTYYDWFTLSGSTITCTETGTTGVAMGYWISGITYQWYAW